MRNQVHPAVTEMAIIDESHHAKSTVIARDTGNGRLLVILRAFLKPTQLP